MAAFVAKQMVGNKLSAVKGEWRIFCFYTEHRTCSTAAATKFETISSIFLSTNVYMQKFCMFETPQKLFLIQLNLLPTFNIAYKKCIQF